MSVKACNLFDRSRIRYDIIESSEEYVIYRVFWYERSIRSFSGISRKGAKSTKYTKIFTKQFDFLFLFYIISQFYRNYLSFHMEKFTLIATSRDTETKLSTIRAEKKVPAVVYGHKVTAQAITVGASELLKVFRKSGKTHIVELTLDGKKQDVLIHEVQRAPVSGDFLHVDFFVVSATEKIHVQIPVHLTGTSPAQVQGGLVEQNMHAVEVKCLPKNLVDAFEADLSKLENLGDIIHVRDLDIDMKKFDILSDLDGAIVSIHLPKGTQEEEVVAVAAAEVPSVQEEKKAEKEAKSE